MAEITLEKVIKTYGAVGVVHGIDLAIAHQEFVVLVGPSGCGKSTTLNLIAGLEQVTGGQVFIDGRDVTAAPPGARDVAMVFQSYALYPHLDVRGNLAFPLEVAGLPKEERVRRVDETAEWLGLSPLLSRKPRELSGGQRQRVALGRALVRRPKVFLFDEPLSNLDAHLRGQMRAEIKKLHERLAATFIYVTHDQAEAMTLSDRVVLLRAGAIEQVGPPRKLYEEPSSEFVASFFGTPPINLVPPKALGTVAREGVKLGLRPEHLAVGGETTGAVSGTVYLVEPMGADAFVTVELAGGVRVIARAGPDFSAPTGTRVWVRRTAPGMWFDQTSGQRVEEPPAR